MPDDSAATATPDPAPAQEPAKQEPAKDAPLGEAGEKALEAWKQRAKEAEAKVKELVPLAERARELEEANKSELEKAQDKLAKTEKERDEAKAALLRFEVAKEKEIPAEAIDLLNGTSREELEASADKILSLVKSRTDDEPKPDFNGGPREPAPEPDPPDKAHNSTVLQVLGIQPKN